MIPSLRESIGAVAGAALAPLVALVSAGRRARALHPDGLVFLADVRRHPDASGANEALAQRLAGPAIARLSGALWRRGFEHIDVLGLALRFRRSAQVTTEPAEDDQDLLFATVRSPFTLALSPFTTRAGDYLANTYCAVSPFAVGTGRKVKFRLVPESAGSPEGSSRDERLRRAQCEGRATFRLDARATYTQPWKPVAIVTLRAEIPIDQQALRFSPFRTGRGVIPRGFVHAIRRAAYPASRWGSERSQA